MQSSNLNYDSFTNLQEGGIGHIKASGGTWCVMTKTGEKTYDGRDVKKVKSEHKSKAEAQKAAIENESVCEIFKMANS